MIYKQLGNTLEKLPHWHDSIVMTLETAFASGTSTSIPPTLSRAQGPELYGAFLLRAKALILQIRDTIYTVDHESADACRSAGVVVATSTASSWLRPVARVCPGHTCSADLQGLCTRVEELSVVKERLCLSNWI